jgi:putative transposase
VAGAADELADGVRLGAGGLLEQPVEQQPAGSGGSPVTRFAAFIAAHPELRHIRTRVKTPGQNGVRERAFESLKYERPNREEILDVLDLTSNAEEFRIEFNTIRPHEALSWNRPQEVHLGLANPTTPTFERAEILPLS